MDALRGDVCYTAYISDEEARCGTTRTWAFHTAAGQVRAVTIAIPAGVRSGDYVVAGGRGGPDQAGQGYGDFWVAVQVGGAAVSTASGYASATEALAVAGQRCWPLPAWPGTER